MTSRAWKDRDKYPRHWSHMSPHWWFGVLSAFRINYVVKLPQLLGLLADFSLPLIRSIPLPRNLLSHCKYSVKSINCLQFRWQPSESWQSRPDFLLLTFILNLVELWYRVVSAVQRLYQALSDQKSAHYYVVRTYLRYGLLINWLRYLLYVVSIVTQAFPAGSTITTPNSQAIVNLSPFKARISN